ncbi:MAG: CDP-diacylglycerol--glycerol-3-phosphate 3-phosphatidyltransferase [Gammaproteobacteria bacterium]
MFQRIIRDLPNCITLFRIVLIPIFVGVFYLQTPWSHTIAAAIFALAGLTDWLDGYLARALGQTSHLGAFLDPVADKLLVAVALVLIVGEIDIPYLAIPAAVIVGREVVVSALREWMAEMGKRTSVAVSFIGKIKTATQMLAIFTLLLYVRDNEIVAVLGASLLYIAAFLTLWSMIMYLRVAWPDLKHR